MPSDSNYSGLLLVWLVLLGAISQSDCSTEIFPVCKPGEEFWSVEKGACSPCTECAPEFTLSPCAIHKDAICGPLSALELDWSFLSTRRKSEAGQQDPVTPSTLWRFSEPEEQRRKPSDVRERELVDIAQELDRKVEFPFADDFKDTTKDSRARRTSGEAGGIPWDWQTGALVLAVCACIVFFLVAGCSALVYVRQWRRMKRNFEPAGLEEISARLNLMVKAELAELTAGAPMNPGDPETRCQYLEKLLDRKRETPVVAAGWSGTSGNLYIEERETTPGSKRSQIARIHRNIESILSHKNTSEKNESQTT
ncbi:uncharacterized protein wgn [Venturia canescens]|uniref:uncharacterized protein wgn n=1 Tax=Venturia canescens TaxID=32260 RepID=UPI001C9C1430|nr:uncharacterized protein LOC122407132 [Venturia canescens]